MIDKENPIINDLSEIDDDDPISEYESVRSFNVLSDRPPTPATVYSLPQSRIDSYSSDDDADNVPELSDEYDDPEKDDMLPRVAELLTFPQVPQKSPEWFAQRMELITASNVGAILGHGHFTTRKQVLLKKCGLGPEFKGSPATAHGNKYEDVAIQMYERNNKTKVYEFGVIRHRDIPFLGASPDGITKEGRMLEIKCPYSRVIDEEVPVHYWHQMQLQMECCDLEVCDFLECEIREFPDREDFLDNLKPGWQRKGRGRMVTRDGKECGILIRYWDDVEEENRYLYPPLNTPIETVDWIIDNVLSAEPNKYKWVQSIYWKCNVYWPKVVPRKREWFTYALPELTKFWDEVTMYKEDIDKLKKDLDIKKNGRGMQLDSSSSDDEEECLLHSDHDSNDHNDEY